MLPGIGGGERETRALEGKEGVEGKVVIVLVFSKYLGSEKEEDFRSREKK